MKKLISITIILTSFFGCAKKQKELFLITDTFIESAKNNNKQELLEVHPEDSLYTVRLNGNSVIVEINHLPTTDRYISLKNELIERYKGNFDVKNIGLNGFGDIIIQVQ